MRRGARTIIALAAMWAAMLAPALPEETYDALIFEPRPTPARIAQILTHAGWIVSGPEQGEDKPAYTARLGSWEANLVFSNCEHPTDICDRLSVSLLVRHNQEPSDVRMSNWNSEQNNWVFAYRAEDGQVGLGFERSLKGGISPITVIADFKILLQSAESAKQGFPYPEPVAKKEPEPTRLESALAQGQSQAQVLTQAYNASGQALFKQFAAEPGNILFSPYSIGTAMAMALAGARGETEREMASVLRQRLSRDQMNAANAAVLSILNGYDKSAVQPDCPSGTKIVGDHCEGAPVTGGYCPGRAHREGDRCVAAPNYPASAKLLAANALMITKSGAALISQDYSALLAKLYDAGILQNVSLDDVNGWVYRRTEGKIDRILDQLNPAATAVILNAVYFKAKWAEVFSPESTENNTFNLTRTQRVSVPTMQRSGRYVLVARPGYRALRLPYNVTALGMVIVLPNEIDSLPEITARIDANELSQLFASLRATDPTQIALALPRFKVTFKADLVESFEQLGMVRAFVETQADFSGMTGSNRTPLFISEIAHRAIIEVMEDGTEAAAATAIVMAPGAGRPQKAEPFRVDRPFLYYVVDDASGAILFQGRVVDPS